MFEFTKGKYLYYLLDYNYERTKLAEMLKEDMDECIKRDVFYLGFGDDGIIDRGKYTKKWEESSKKLETLITKTDSKVPKVRVYAFGEDDQERYDNYLREHSVKFEPFKFNEENFPKEVYCIEDNGKVYLKVRYITTELVKSDKGYVSYVKNIELEDFLPNR